MARATPTRPPLELVLGSNREMVASLRGLLELLASHGHAEERTRVKACIASLPSLWDQLDTLSIGREGEDTTEDETQNQTQKCSTKNAKESIELIKMATTKDEKLAKPESMVDTQKRSKNVNTTEEAKVDSPDTTEEGSGRVLLAWCSLFHDPSFGLASSTNSSLL